MNVLPVPYIFDKKSFMEDFLFFTCMSHNFNQSWDQKKKMDITSNGLIVV